MASVLSLKELRDSSTLKTEIRSLEEEKQGLLNQLERQKQLELKLRDDLLNQKKDFEHLEKQFDHFADIEAEFDALQQEVQMERLERMIEDEKREIQQKNQLKKAKEDSKVIQDELKELKKLDPVRLKRQVGDLKKKSITQAAENKSINSALVSTRKELKETTAEKEQLEKDYKAAQNQSDFFWQSTEGEWLLFETGLILKDEKVEKGSEPKRIQCLNTITGISVVSKELNDKDSATWHGDLEIPSDVSKEAGKRLKKIAAEQAEESED
ncbi:hypothetical protein OAP18_02975 [Gammaproteobacteria bacterium]|nr:hypothetical protein [Gammaproteobacteria bacterium]